MKYPSQSCETIHVRICFMCFNVYAFRLRNLWIFVVKLCIWQQYQASLTTHLNKNITPLKFCFQSPLKNLPQPFPSRSKFTQFYASKTRTTLLTIDACSQRQLYFYISIANNYYNNSYKIKNVEDLLNTQIKENCYEMKHIKIWCITTRDTIIYPG